MARALVAFSVGLGLSQAASGEPLPSSGELIIEIETDDPGSSKAGGEKARFSGSRAFRPLSGAQRPPSSWDSGGEAPELLDLSSRSETSASVALDNPGLSPVGESLLPPALRVDRSPAGTFSPLLHSGPHPPGRLRIRYGQIPLSRLVPARSALRLLPDLVTSGWTLRSGVPGVSDAGEDFSPVLSLVPCDGRACFESASEQEEHGMWALGIEGQERIQGAIALGFSDGSQASSGLPVVDAYTGVETLHDNGRVRVRDDRNTPRFESDDRVVELQNNDWSRLTGVQSLALTLPQWASRVQTHILVSEVDEGMSTGPQAVNDTGRSRARLSLAEVKSETLVGSAGERFEINLGGLLHDQRTLRSPFTASDGVQTSEQEWGQIGLGFRTRRNSGALRQLLIRSNNALFSARQTNRPFTGGEETSVFRIRESSQTLGLLWAPLSSLPGLTLASVASLRSVRESARAICLPNDFSECPSRQRAETDGTSQLGLSLGYEEALWSLKIFVGEQERRPDPFERFGHPSGIQPSPSLSPESRFTTGALVHLAGFETGYLFARDRDAIRAVTLANLSVRFENLGAALWHHGYLAWASPRGREWELAVRAELTRAYLEDRPQNQMAGVPLARAFASAGLQVLSLPDSAFGQARTHLGLTADWSHSEYIDEANLLERDWEVKLSPSVAQEFQSRQGRRFRVLLGMDIALPKVSTVRDALGGRFRDYSLASGAAREEQIQLRLGMRGDF